MISYNWAKLSYNPSENCPMILYFFGESPWNPGPYIIWLFKDIVWKHGPQSVKLRFCAHKTKWALRVPWEPLSREIHQRSIRGGFSGPLRSYLAVCHYLVWHLIFQPDFNPGWCHKSWTCPYSLVTRGRFYTLTPAFLSMVPWSEKIDSDFQYIECFWASCMVRL